MRTHGEVDVFAAQAYRGCLKFIAFVALTIFLPAWTLNYWQGWAMLFVFGGFIVFITAYFLKHDRALVERRMKAGPTAEKEPTQKLIQTVTSLILLGIIIGSTLDWRFGWSPPLPPALPILGDVLIALGFWAIFTVFKVNSFTSATVELGEGQKVVSTGPYALVRHPMYSGALLMMVGIPLALGSLFGLIGSLAMTLALVWRLTDEERFLGRGLEGYEDYRRKVRWRLIPGLF